MFCDREQRPKLIQYVENISLAQNLVYPLLAFDAATLAVTAVVCGAMLITGEMDETMTRGAARMIHPKLRHDSSCVVIPSPSFFSFFIRSLSLFVFVVILLLLLSFLADNWLHVGLAGLIGISVKHALACRKVTCTHINLQNLVVTGDEAEAQHRESVRAEKARRRQAAQAEGDVGITAAAVAVHMHAQAAAGDVHVDGD